MQGQTSKSGTHSDNVLTLSPKQRNNFKQNKLSLTDVQQDCVTHLYERDETLLISATGTGKTVITLTTINELQREGVIGSVIVVAPAKVTGGWVKDSVKWGLNIDVIACTGKKKIAEAVKLGADVYVTSYESLPTLLAMNHGADAIVYDEVTRLKASGGKTFKAIRKNLKRFKWKLGLSATPLSESWEAVYGICLMLDGGERFGRNKEIFMQTYFNQLDYKGYQFEIKQEMVEIIGTKLASLSYVVEESEKRKELLPPNYLKPIKFKLSDEVKTMQDEIADDALISMGDVDVIAVNAAVVSGKLRQLAQGFVIDELERAHLVDDSRINLFIDALVNKVEKGGVVGTYEFSFIGTEIYKRLAKGGVYADIINGSTSKQDFDGIMQRWREGRGSILLLQVKAGSHGLDGLQMSAAQMLHFAPIWSRDATEQLTGRLDRTGQVGQVEVQTIIAEGSIDATITNRVKLKGNVFKQFLMTINGEEHEFS